jgi:hypothetical protein
MRKTLHGAFVVFVFSGLLWQLMARWSPVLYSRLSPPGGRTETIATDSNDPMPVDSTTTE